MLLLFDQVVQYYLNVDDYMMMNLIDDGWNVYDDDRNYQMEHILLQIFLYHEYNVDVQVKHDQHHHNLHNQ